ncbi:nuclear-pore anchor-like isoform X3 [Glycine soja]|uniref:nuclear-pore anchor-like isoform X3 n=1 Tax=Glycine soja TaxID=3848 RepID=UPI00103D18C2|nr:nuclear-pore anchor-like isoform X3 [Glycine soja]
MNVLNQGLQQMKRDQLMIMEPPSLSRSRKWRVPLMGPMLMMEWNGIQNLMWERKYPVAMMLTNSMVVKYVVAQVPQDVHDAKPSNTVKCLIMDWKWHKDHCIARDVDSAPIERSRRDVGFLKNSYEEEESIRSSYPLSLEFHPEESTSFKSPIEVSQDPTNKVLYLEDEVAKSRNEILLLQSELDEWKNRANFAREKFQSLKRESNYQLLVLKNEKESIAEAETRARNVIHSLHKKLNHLQNVVQESIAEKRKLEEDIQSLESECADLKKQLQEEHKHAQRLTMESDKSREAAKIAMREVEAVRQELQEEREHAQRLKENFHRDVIFSESRATFAEAKLSDLYRKIRMSDYKVCSICLSNDRDLAFGCGHMTCRDCGSKLSKCPICREQITNHIKLFTG